MLCEGGRPLAWTPAVAAWMQAEPGRRVDVLWVR